MHFPDLPTKLRTLRNWTRSIGTRFWEHRDRCSRTCGCSTVWARPCPAARRIWSTPTAMTWCSTVSRSEEHTSELQSLMRISYAVFCLKKKKRPQHYHYI